MRHSIVFRVALAYSLGFAVATALLGSAVAMVAHRALARQFDHRISTEMSSLLSEYGGEGEAALRAIIRNREAAHVTSDMAYGLFAGTRRTAGSIGARPATIGWQTLTFVDPREGQDSARALAVDIAPGRRLVVAADWDMLTKLDRLILSLLSAALAAVIVLGTLGALGLAAYLRSRLSVIAGGAERIIAGDLDQRMPVGARGDEFDRLAAILNVMLDRIAILLANLRQVSADVAHDLRLPLTRLRHQLERGLEDDRPRAAMEKAIGQTDAVLALFASILRLSEIEAGQLRRGFAPIDLPALMAELAESYGPAIEDGGRSLSIDLAPAPPIAGDHELLAQALINLLDNAQTHTPPGTRIAMRLALVPGHVRVSVADDGPGVPAADRSRIAGRFIRLQASRGTPGNGLGLSLVAAIARMHGATLSFADRRPGLIAIVDFPA